MRAAIHQQQTTSEIRPDPRPIDVSSRAAFVRTALPYADRVQRERGYPAAIILAMACLESNYGKSAPGNNFFGIKADPSWRGRRFEAKTWEDLDGKRVEISAWFRAYDDPTDSFRDLAEFLERNPRYGEALRWKHDPERFIGEVWEAGYATDGDYPKKVLGIVRDWGLLG